MGATHFQALGETVKSKVANALGRIRTSEGQFHIRNARLIPSGTITLSTMDSFFDFTAKLTPAPKITDDASNATVSEFQKSANDHVP